MYVIIIPHSGYPVVSFCKKKKKRFLFSVWEEDRNIKLKILM